MMLYEARILKARLELVVDLLGALAAEGNEDLDCLGRIADGLGGKFARK